MEVILELVLELLIDGAITAVSERKVPIWLRVLAGAILTLFYGFFFGIFAWIGIRNKSILMITITGTLAIAILAVVIVKSNKIIKRRKEGQMSC